MIFTLKDVLFVRKIQHHAIKGNSRTVKFKRALDDIAQLGLSVREAASKWRIPKSTLHDRLNGRIEVDRRSGPPTVLTKVEETRIADWLIEMAHRVFGARKTTYWIPSKNW